MSATILKRGIVEPYEEISPIDLYSDPAADPGNARQRLFGKEDADS